MAQRGDARYRRLTYPPTAAAAISSVSYVVGGGGGKAKTGVPNRITLVAKEAKPDLQVLWRGRPSLRQQSLLKIYCQEDI